MHFRAIVSQIARAVSEFTSMRELEGFEVYLVGATYFDDRDLLYHVYDKPLGSTACWVLRATLERTMSSSHTLALSTGQTVSHRYDAYVRQRRESRIVRQEKQRAVVACLLCKIVLGIARITHSCRSTLWVASGSPRLPGSNSCSARASFRWTPRRTITCRLPSASTPASAPS